MSDGVRGGARPPPLVGALSPRLCREEATGKKAGGGGYSPHRGKLYGSNLVSDPQDSCPKRRGQPGGRGVWWGRRRRQRKTFVLPNAQLPVPGRLLVARTGHRRRRVRLGNPS